MTYIRALFAENKDQKNLYLNETHILVREMRKSERKAGKGDRDGVRTKGLLNSRDLALPNQTSYVAPPLPPVFQSLIRDTLPLYWISADAVYFYLNYFPVSLIYTFFSFQSKYYFL